MKKVKHSSAIHWTNDREMETLCCKLVVGSHLCCLSDHTSIVYRIISKTFWHPRRTVYFLLRVVPKCHLYDTGKQYSNVSWSRSVIGDISLATYEKLFITEVNPVSKDIILCSNY